MANSLLAITSLHIVLFAVAAFLVALIILLAVIFLFINHRWPQEPATLRIVKIGALVACLVALVWITVKIVWHVV